jgi:hypothetical protein
MALSPLPSCGASLLGPEGRWPLLTVVPLCLLAIKQLIAKKKTKNQ